MYPKQRRAPEDFRCTMNAPVLKLRGRTQIMELDVGIAREEGVCVVTIAGEVDVYTSPVLKERLVEAAEDGCGIMIVDLDQVGFIDSSGLGVLVGALRRLREQGGEMHVVCTREQILKIFRITGLDKVFPIFASMDQARSS
jgi:anti-sigma B factor antagonist